VGGLPEGVHGPQDILCMIDGVSCRRLKVIEMEVWTCQQLFQRSGARMQQTTDVW
jgi:hypothetical protein